MGSFRDAFRGFPQELLEGIRKDNQARLDNAAQEAEMNSIYKATMAFIEAEVPQERAIALLQKYWDLRRSEAIHFWNEASKEFSKE